METRRTRRATFSLKRLHKVFDQSEAALVHSLPIRKTICGIWHPTPVRVIDEAVAVLEGMGLLGEAPRPRAVVDAGLSDEIAALSDLPGRILASVGQAARA